MAASSSGMAAAGGGNIKVVVRVRPFNSRETGRNARCIVSMDGNQTVLTPPTPDGKAKPLKSALEGTKTFAFDKSYWSFDKSDKNYAGQDNLFADLGKPLLDNAFGGYNNCIFAYGQTGSGKSYSMMGYGPEEGVIPKICRNMFERIENVQEDKNMACTVEVSYLEIYNERVRDLLNPSTKGNLKVREHPATGPYVEDLAKLVVRNFKEIDHLMDEGNKARTVAATNMNETSSRSHAVFTLTLTQKRHDVETKMDTEKVAKISLVDLAGSERATSTGATGARLKEGAEINRSLSTLGRVIAALADLSTGKKKGNIQVPYRDSVLTWLLKDSLGGNSMTAMIAAISPADINFEETLSTLRYADSAKRIKNHAVVNEDPNARMIRELKEELAQLRSKLGSGSNVPSEQYASDVPLEKQFVTITQADGSTKRVSKAEIAEQLSQSEKLYEDLNQTWEEKLTRTEQIHKEREAALEELGISIEKGNVGLSTPKKMPHLVNLSDDPLLAECLIYNLKPGTTTVGNVEAVEESGRETTSVIDIRLNGSKILADHCTFENVDGVVTVVPKDGAGVMVNGVRIEQPKRLRSGNRVILGDFHIFRFNHPLEAREERAEQGSLLKYSLTVDQMSSPSYRPGAHERTSSSVSRAMSDLDGDGPGSGAESPAPWRNSGRDLDWNFARREAVSGVLGSDQKISAMTDEELDMLFEDLQKARAVRKARPESRLFDTNGTTDEDTESVMSHPPREKYMSNGTLDNFSLDTALTIPSTPQRNGDDEQQLKDMREAMEEQLEQKKQDYEDALGSATAPNSQVDEIRAQKAKMEEEFRLMKEQMQRALIEQKAEFTKQLKQARMPARYRRRQQDGSEFSDRDVFLAKQTLEHWKRQRYIAMAAAALRNASALKEAQVMSQQMERNIVFQFTIVDVGHTFGSSYDLVLHGISAEETNDHDLESSIKPCLAVRVIDFNRLVVQLWSLEKLHSRLRVMRQMVQYLGRPEYMQHFRLENPFEDDCMPEYTRVGDADIPLAAIFECRVQDFALDVVSPFTSNVIGIVRLSLEPSSAEAPSSTLKFNVVMHEMIGFAEREGTSVHAQLFIPGVSEEDGASTTSLISDFDEGSIRFESVHSMSLPLASPRESCLRVSIFAKVTSMHLDKLLSWDDMREPSARPHSGPGVARLPEHEYYTKERHDVFARVQILEMGESGEYEPTEVVQSNTLDNGAFQLHQGVQRRIVLQLTLHSSDPMPYEEVIGFRAGQVHLLDKSGSVSDIDSGVADVPLTLIAPPIIRRNSDETSSIKVVGQWDSSAHDSLLLNKPTIEDYRVQLTLKWKLVTPRVIRPMDFALDIAVQTRPRTWYRQNSLLAQLWQNTRVVHSATANFTITLKPSTAKVVGDLWRMDTTGEYISGEESLTGWTPRGVSLVKDFVEWRKKKRRTAEIESARGMLAWASTIEVEGSVGHDGAYDGHQSMLLNKYLELWQMKTYDGELMLLKASTDPQESPKGFVDGQEVTPMAAMIEHHAKNASLLKAGWLLSPDASSTRWIRRYVELRRPYLHLYSNDGDEVSAINLTNSRIDAEPQVAQLLQREDAQMKVWAIYTTNKAYLFACRNEKERSEWIWSVDQSYMASNGSTNASNSDDGA